MFKLFSTVTLLFFCFAFNSKLLAQNEFITTWQTTDETISIPIISVDSLTYNYDIEWTNLTNAGVGDGSDTGISTSYSISNLSNGDTYEIKISGAFPAIYFVFSSEATKIQTIEQWGNINWETMYLAFYGCTNLTSNATDAPNLDQVTSMFGMLALTENFNSDLNNWDVSNVSDFVGVFFNASAFDGDISNWNVSNATNMRQMFEGASSFSGDLSNWSVFNVTDMSAMFRDATSFNADISRWNTTSALNMSNMFSGATSFNRNLNDWNVGDVTNMAGMFENAIVFNGPLDDWFTGNVTNMSNMFSGANSFDQSLADWNIGDITNMIGMLDNSGLSKLNYDATLKGWESSFGTPTGVTLGAAGLTYCNGASSRSLLTGQILNWTINGDLLECDPFITTWQTNDGAITIPTPTSGSDPFFYSLSWTNLTNPGQGDGSGSAITGDYTISSLNPGDTYQVSISGDFPRIYFQNFNLTAQDRAKILTIEQWGDQEWSNMSGAFAECVNLTLNATDSPILSNVTFLNSMFRGASAFTGDLSSWDVSNVEDMSNMFQNAATFNGNLSDWNVSNVNFMSSMFRGASSFNGDIDNWDVSNVNFMSSMFSGASSFNRNLNSWEVSNVTAMNSMFEDATSFNGDISNWSVNNVISMSQMFKNCINFNGDLSDWNVGNLRNINEMFANATSFNGDLSNWDVRNVIEMRLMFNGASSFNSDLSDWNVSKVTQMGGMFWNASSFDHNLGSWDISSIQPFEVEASPPLGLDSLFTNSGMSAINYDSTIIGWSVLSAEETQIPLNLSLGAQTLSFCLSSNERATLANDYGWTFYDNGPGCPIPTSQASNISFSNITTSQMDISWTNGNGTERIVIAREGSAINSNPNNLSSYNGNSTFGSGDEVGSGNFVVYNGNGNSLTLNGLSDGTTYHLRVYEYNGSDGLEVYLKSTASGNPASQATLAIPNIIDFTPVSAGTADTITIIGSGFTNANSVSFGGTDALNYTVISDTEIEAIVSSGTSGTVVVSTAGGTASQAGFEFIPAPSISSFLPTAAAAGDTVIITGSNFSDAILSSFGGVAADTFFVVSDTEILAILDSGATGVIRVTTAGGSASLEGFLFIPAPTITRFSPEFAAQGELITITGLNFSNATAVSFGGTPAATFTVISEFEITATVGSGASGSLVVVTPGGTDSEEGFIFIPAPIISSFSPSLAPEGDTVTILGSNFTDLIEVSFGGTNAESFTLISDTAINAVVGPGNSGDVVVSTPGGTSSQAGFEYIPRPIISSFEPRSAMVGDTIVIIGEYFTDVSLVSFGSTPAASYSVVSDTVINAVVGEGSSGPVVVNTLGGNASQAGFTLIFSQIGLFWNDNQEIEDDQAEAIVLGAVSVGNTLESQIIILNSGNTDLIISNIGSSSEEFEIQSTIDTVKAGFPAPITIIFNASEVGVYNSRISISNNSRNSPEFRFNVTAELTDLNVIDDDTDSLVISNQDINLGSTLINVNVDKNFSIENLSATSTIQILSITVDDPVFQIVNAPTSIAPSSLEEFTVRLNAGAIGEYSGNVTVTTNLNDFTFRVNGTVVEEFSTEIKVYNVVTPNGDGRHDFLQIDNITEYQNNKVSIFNRLGNRVFEIENYDNTSRIFEGISDDGEELLTGNYYYVIDKGNGDKRISGFLLIKR